jgi:hypothetical protein
MKKLMALSTAILFAAAGCSDGRQTDGDLITVDVLASYPKKELILQDIIDVEYVPLETTDEFLTQGIVQAVGKDIIVVKNDVSDGDIFIFDRNGKGLRKINRKGQGSEEYVDFSGIMLDDDKGELFINDANIRKIMVYDLDGNFKRSLEYKEGVYYGSIFNFGRDYLITIGGLMSADGTISKDPFLILSKQDGSVIREIEVPYKERKTIAAIFRNEATGVIYFAGPSSSNSPVIPFYDRWILAESSADTLYVCSSDYALTPLIARTPSIQSMDPEIFLLPGVLTDRYYFMQTVKKTFDFETREGFPSVSLAYDRQEKKIYEVTVYNDDYSDKKKADMMTVSVNTEIATWQRLEAPDLVEAYKNGELTGRLAEIASTLDEEDNPVIMLMKYKK